MSGRFFLAVTVLAHLALGAYPSKAAGPVCPIFLQPLLQPGALTALGPPPRGLIGALFTVAYTAWSDRISRPDIAIHSNPNVWKTVPEFAELTRAGKLYLPFILEKLREGDFRLVPVIECITRIHSVRLYPNPMPLPGTFGLQDVATLWVTNGAQVVEAECRAGCAANAACEQKCSDERQQYWN
jgi:hypothetical protein